MRRGSDSWQEEVSSLDYASSAAAAFRSFLLVLGFTLLTGLAAQIHISLPYTPIPITMQTLVVLLSGAFLGPWRGAISQSLYLLWGVLGLPLFAGATTGWAILAGPSGGYLVGFILATLYVGKVIKGAQGTFGITTVYFFGTAVILFAGWFHMVVFFEQITPSKGFHIGVAPFLPGALIKVVLATLITFVLKRYKPSWWR